MGENLRCCFTGPRPQKFSFPLKDDNKDFNDFTLRLYDAIAELISIGVCEFYTGMAMGFDILAAEAVLQIAKLRPELCLRLIACVPFKEQAQKYPGVWKKRYDNVLKNCDEALLLSDNYFSGCYQRRNEYMVNVSDMVLTYFDGKAGGTKNTVMYAMKKERKIVNIYK